ncbi:MAG: hypothetical protein HY231_23975 [Acidobacteria bacterium]|nr:hypothetical protein [Acidobacteriota bacterium]
MKNFLPKTLKEILACLLTVTLIVAVIPFAIVGYRLKEEITPVKIRNLINSAQNIGDSATLNANAYGLVADTTSDLMKRNIAPAVDRIASRVDSTMVRFERKLDLIEPLLIALTNNSNNLSILMLDTNRNLNSEAGWFAALTDTTKRGGTMISNQDQALQGLASEGKATLAELREIVTSDEWKQLRGELLASMKNITSLSHHADGIATHTDETIIEGRDILKRVKGYLETYAPGILASLEKISKATSKYQKATLLANIFRLIAIGIGAL